MSRNRFLLVKHCFHLGQDSKVEGNRFKKARLIIKHQQAKFTEMNVLKQEISHYEAIIKYFGKSGLKQSIRNKPMRFGYIVWVLATVSGYVMFFEM